MSSVVFDESDKDPATNSCLSSNLKSFLFPSPSPAGLSIPWHWCRRVERVFGMVFMRTRRDMVETFKNLTCVSFWGVLPFLLLWFGF